MMATMPNAAPIMTMPRAASPTTPEIAHVG